MNANTCLFLHLARAAALCLWVALPLAAQEAATAPPQGGDPFVRNAESAGNPAASKPKTPEVVHGLVEYIEVPRNAWLEYTGAHPVSYDATPLRAEVQRWIAEGKAKPIEIACVPSVSGNRTVVESNIERILGMGHVMATPQPVPNYFETRNEHFSFEWEPITAGTLGKIEAQFAVQLVSHAEEPRNDGLPRTPGSTAAFPRFNVVKISSNVSAPPSQVSLLQVATPRDAGGKPREDARLLLFLRSAPVPVTLPEQPLLPQLQFFQDGWPQRMTREQWEALQKNESAKATVQAINEQLAQRKAWWAHGPVIYEIERLAVDLADLNRWFAEKPLTESAPGLRAAARQWIAAGRGRELDRVCGSMQSGNRGVWEDVEEFRYPVSYAVEGSAPEQDRPHPALLKPQTFEQHLQLRETLRRPAPVALKNPVVTAESHNTRNVGYVIEMEPVIAPDGRSIRLQIAVRNTRYCGSQVLHEREVNGKMEPSIEQPIFATMQTSTNIAVGLGHPALVGVHTPADENARPHPTERILTFITFRN